MLWQVEDGTNRAFVDATAMWDTAGNLWERNTPGAECTVPAEVWFVQDDLHYRHLKPGTWAVASMVLPDSGLFPHDRGRMAAELVGFVKNDVIKVLSGCPIRAELCIDGLRQGGRYVDPAVWTPDVIQREPLGSVVLDRGHVFTVRLTRPEYKGLDIVALVGVAFTLEAMA